MSALDRILAQFPGAKRQGAGYMTRCPAHKDTRPSLSIREGDDGRVLIFCFGGCQSESVLAAVGLTFGDLYENGPAASRLGEPVALYDYYGSSGALLYQVVRYSPKEFRQRRRGPNGVGWIWDLKGIERVPYNLAEVKVEAATGGIVFVPEGEKDVETLGMLGLVATTNSSGAGQWSASHAAHLRGACVVVLPDNDAVGRRHAATVAATCLAAGARWVRIVELPNLPPGGDVSDWVADGGTVQRLLDLVRDTPASQVEPSAAVATTGESDSPSAPFTDIGNGERLVSRNGGRIRFVHGLGWHIYNDVLWCPDDTLEIERLAKDTIRSINQEAARTADAKLREEVLKHAKRSESNSRVKAMLERARAELGIPLRVTQLDADPWALNVQNGIIDLRRGELGQHDPTAYCSKLAPVKYDPTATCPLWLSFLDRVFSGNQELIAFVQRAFAYSLTGSTEQQVLFLLHGSGSNGKSTLLEILHALLGSYAARARFTTLMVRRAGGSASEDIARLDRMRVVTSVETAEDQQLNESLVKSLTGSDTVVARYLYQGSFEFVPQFKLWLATNRLPDIRGTDDGIWRRILLIPFAVHIARSEWDVALKEKICANELAGVLHWAVLGLASYRERGLAPPDIVLGATEAYRSDSDTFQVFIDECCEVRPNALTPATALFGRYKHWSEGRGERAGTQTWFGRRLSDRGFEAVRGRRSSGGRALRRGLVLQPVERVGESSHTGPQTRSEFGSPGANPLQLSPPRPPTNEPGDAQ